ncbi:thiosulfate sulfurtransferase GlpE [Gallaecimonas sp. GXIMD4217]|uniref:thiosulfate sulfurtransferase GlpE n=1 Tax=Gallaecimonas sp. GXIMD4217 TaxID=3131927 RepID=UPI00311B343B
MEQFAHISIESAFKMLEEGRARLVDIRDEGSFAGARIDGAYHLTNGSLHQFMTEADFDTPVIVCCYHGISSQGAAQYLVHQGFEEVYSLDGGFEAWRKTYPYVGDEDPR